jgi:hypothetical protein
LAETPLDSGNESIAQRWGLRKRPGLARAPPPATILNGSAGDGHNRKSIVPVTDSWRGSSVPSCSSGSVQRTQVGHWVSCVFMVIGSQGQTNGGNPAPFHAVANPEPDAGHPAMLPDFRDFRTVVAGSRGRYATSRARQVRCCRLD